MRGNFAGDPFAVNSNCPFVPELSFQGCNPHSKATPYNVPRLDGIYAGKLVVYVVTRRTLDVFRLLLI